MLGTFEETFDEIDVESINKDVTVQCSLCKCDVKSLSNSANMPQHEGKEKCKINMFRIENLKDKPDIVQFYTGFDSYSHFMFVLSLFGDEVNNLKYPSMQPSQGKHALTPCNEFYLTHPIMEKYV
ncbi:hypothetical protein NQ314_012412 [Rhamnusium bicolor]|uniref:Uncharacterized protein n=1 Tax=Rhamnusium bicolor TaxID=1586634 RepID=A0AAV8XCK1_9CUCU|nr:hypothetical protein NQ314_012412 [Rhamnusium bicolor]